ncbi:class I SAM-dependent methyltransferase [Rufibacter latericius]|uniref:Class I SAM-dependent methyltransferase n=1 Tax=Rufibacter latericius TaxID=2487040 RepID=A0A3M9MAY5_9BACT|nr:class I SAM-dependent methyltransferase [Rufibacter latericius]RNI22686.1 hypothetical protein EFB08_21575 [Rufibacter latericius]
MKRIHLFEFEDFPWFPDWLRISLTRLIVVMHRVLGTREDIATLLHKVLPSSAKPSIIDLCSGSGGPMMQVFETLREEPHLKGLTLTLTDLYPNQKLAHKINQSPTGNISYLTSPVDATHLPSDLVGVRTMVCSFHHMRPEPARKILQNAFNQRQPICIYEISDNSYPSSLWWIALPFNFLTPFFITPLVRPLSWKQLVFTYLIPIIPFFFAWDGAVSNARTYTLNDLDSLLKGLEAEDYVWEKGILQGKSKKIYLLGMALAK